MPPGPGGATNRCVFGYCASAPDVGCNPGDPANVVGCGECKRAGNCFSLNEPQPGLFAATTSCAGATCIAACRSNQTCDGARAPFTTAGTCGDGTNECGCFVAMAPATEPAGGDNPAMEAPGFNLSYSNGAFQFRKDRTLLPQIVPHASGFEVTPVWGNVFLGRGWTLGVKSRDVKTGLMEFSIAVDRDSMPVRPARCVGSPSRTELRTSFTLDDGSGRPLLVTATLPWQCRGTELRLP